MTLSKIQRREQQETRLATMKTRRQPRYEHWREITQYIIPYAGRYLVTDRDSEPNRYQDIIDETGIFAVQTLEAGMMSTRTNPMVPWFRSQTPDPDLNLFHPVRVWLADADEMARRILRKSNSYLALPHLYSETATFGTGATIMVDDFHTVIHHHLLTAGEYVIATDPRGHVNTLYREFQMTVAELVEEFGIDAVSDTVKEFFESGRKGDVDSLIPVVHAIEPRPIYEREPGKLDARNMAWRSIYFEADSDHGEILRETGHRQFPCIVPRWRVVGNDVWGEGPGTTALGSTRELQETQLMKARTLDHQSDPSLQVPTSYKGRERDLQPGGRFPFDQTAPHGGVRVAFDHPGRIADFQVVIEDVRERIRQSFFVPMFQPITAISDTTMRTAQEILQRSSEMLTVLGPVTIRHHNELDLPLLERIYERMFETGLLRPAPPELQGMPIDLEFIGPMAQALKNIEAQSQSRFRAHLGEIATLKPSAVDNYDADADVQRISDQLGVHPDLIVPGQQVALIRQVRAQQEQAMANAEAVATTASAAKDLAAADTSQQNALTDVMAGVSG